MERQSSKRKVRVGRRVDIARRILTEVAEHPSNRGHRTRAIARAIAWQTRKRVVRRPLTISVYGSMRLQMQPQSGSCSNYAYFGEFFEYDEMKFLTRYLRPGDAFIDGGANIGGYSLLAASVLGPSGRVDAFEPAPLTAGWLRQNVAINGLDRVVIVHEAALSDRQGTAAFTDDLDVSNTLASAAPVSRRSALVPTVRLDAAVTADRQYAFAKFDLEGAEHMALLGAETMLSRGNPSVVMVEVLEYQLAKFGSSIDAVLNALESWNYRIGYYRADSNVLVFDRTAAGADRANVLAIHESRMSETASRLQQDFLAPGDGSP